MHKIDKSLLKFDTKKHPAEASFLAIIKEGSPDIGPSIEAARKIGLSWPTIFALLMQFGPGFLAALQAILAALATTPPAPLRDAPPAPSAAWRSKFKKA